MMLMNYAQIQLGRCVCKKTQANISLQECPMAVVRLSLSHSLVLSLFLSFSHSPFLSFIHAYRSFSYVHVRMSEHMYTPVYLYLCIHVCMQILRVYVARRSRVCAWCDSLKTGTFLFLSSLHQYISRYVLHECFKPY